MKFFPLDEHVTYPAMLMDLVETDKKKGMREPAAWRTYQSILSIWGRKGVKVAKIERFKFYELARGAYAVVATGEKTPYGNIILQKGVIA